MPDPSVRSVTTTPGSALPTITLNKPSGTVQGDVLLAFITNGDSSNFSIASVPPGWTLLTSHTNTAEVIRTYVYYKVASASEPASYDWGWNAGNDAWNAAMVCVQDADATPLIVGTAAQSTPAGVNHQTPSATFPTPGTLIFCVAHSGYEPTGVSWTPPSGYTEHVDLGNARWSHLHVSTKSGSGTEQPTAVISASTNGGIALIFGVEPLSVMPSGIVWDALPPSGPDDYSYLSLAGIGAPPTLIALSTSTAQVSSQWFTVNVFAQFPVDAFDYTWIQQPLEDGGVSDITASSNVTLTIQASGNATVLVTGNSSATLAITASGSTTVLVTGSSSGTLAITASGSTAVLVTASSTATLPAITGSATASVPLTASSTGTLAVTASGQAKVLVTASSSGTLVVTSSSSTSMAVVASSSATLVVTSSGTTSVLVTTSSSGTLTITASGTTAVLVTANSSATLGVGASGLIGTSGGANSSATLVITASGQASVLVTTSSVVGLAVASSSTASVLVTASSAGTLTVFASGSSSSDVQTGSTAGLGITATGSISVLVTASSAVTLGVNALGFIVTAGAITAPGCIHVFTGPHAVVDVLVGSSATTLVYAERTAELKILIGRCNAN